MDAISKQTEVELQAADSPPATAVSFRLSPQPPPPAGLGAGILFPGGPKPKSDVLQAKKKVLGGLCQPAAHWEQVREVLGGRDGVELLKHHMCLSSFVCVAIFPCPRPMVPLLRLLCAEKMDTRMPNLKFNLLRAGAIAFFIN